MFFDQHWEEFKSNYEKKIRPIVIKMLVTMGGLTEKGDWKQYDFLPFAMFRKQWQRVVLKVIQKGVSEKEKKKSTKTTKGVRQ